ncbi:hypothetical protein DPMN_160888 [Dreissena polymorpha]|uniref:C3H1-type domain-containing protein n=1 Tax=Dreissena polymorpha TaxID=45954 RepID=A0A9D4ENP9_DREPO|nr:hypothetical protein DPMN_160888 [Dreissena polymorpha]
MSWREYDHQFRSRQVVMPSSWSALNLDLWLRCMSFRETGVAQMKTGRYFCRDFLTSSCRFGHSCKFEHVCFNCGGSHPFTSCSPGNREHSGLSNIYRHPNAQGLEVSRYRGQPRGAPRSMPFHRPGRGGFGR